MKKQEIESRTEELTDELNKLRPTKKSKEKKIKMKELKDELEELEKMVPEEAEEVVEAVVETEEVVEAVVEVEEEIMTKMEPMLDKEEKLDIDDIDKRAKDAEEALNKEEDGKLKCQFVMDTPDNRRVPIHFGGGVSMHLRRGDVVYLTQEQYESFKTFFILNRKGK